MGQCTDTYDLSSWQVRQFAALVALVARILVLGFTVYKAACKVGVRP